MAQVPIHLARMAGVPEDETRRRRSARVADTIDVTDSAVTGSPVPGSTVTDSTSVTDALPQPPAEPAPTPAPKPTRVRPGQGSAGVGTPARLSRSAPEVVGR